VGLIRALGELLGGAFKSRRGCVTMRLVIALALLIACRRRKGGGTNNLCAHRFQRVMAERSLRMEIPASHGVC
jgi:hypothetical protein